MNSILFLPCNNGLGHIRRLSILANKMNFKKNKIFFCLDIKKKNRFKFKKNVKKILFSNTQKKDANILNKNINYNNFTKIISDTIISKKFILTKNKNIVFANFFWEEIYNKELKNIKELKKKRIIVFSNYLFSNIKAKIKIIKVGFFEKFKPSCKSNNPQDCTKKELIHAFENTILYTDYFLSLLIKRLEKLDHQSFMIYASDHGESLGELGLYLHGAPRKFAPKEQIHIPWFMWFSDQYKKNNKLDFIKEDTEITHEYFPHTILKALKIESTLLKENKSLIK